MPLGMDWLVDVRDYFVEAPVAMVLVAIVLHVIYSKRGMYDQEAKNQFKEY